MKIKMSRQESIDNKDCFFCYSFNLQRFLKDEKGIDYIDRGEHHETKKIFYVYLKTSILDEALQEWTQRKKEGNLYIDHKGDD